MNQKLNKLRAPLIPERVRRIAGQGFSFIHHRFLRDGFLEVMSHDELALYLYLVLAGNRDGVSFYRYDAICSTLRMTLDDYIDARNMLIERDLIAFDGTRYQVLSLPDAPMSAPREPLNEHDPASTRSTIPVIKHRSGF